MKTRRLTYLSLLLIGVISACRTTPPSTETTAKKKPQPNEYWTTKRSHPIYGFDEKAFFKGMKAVAASKNESAKIGVSLNETWQQEGPVNIGGRVDVITPLHRTSDTIFAGTPNGGIFRTYDGGVNWQPVFDNFSYLAIGAISVDPSNTQIVYAGTGDRNFGGGSYNGNGLYKSTDLGENWTHVGLQQVGIITSCIVHPSHPDWLLVGAMGSGYEKTTDRGVYRSTDGGATWQNTLFVSDSSGVCEMVADPQNPDVIYATTFNRVNLYGNSIADGPDGKIFKSTDAGATWVQLTNGLPVMNTSRVGIAVAESNPDKLYAVYVSTDYQLYDIYVSSDAGSSWTSIDATSPTNGLDPGVMSNFGWYFGRIHVNPFNENHIILPGVDQFASTDGGLNWARNVPEWWTYEVHADKHALYFQDSLTMVIGTDGGMYKTTDAGQNWTVFGELPITQFYRVTATTFANGIYAGGAQDNGTCAGNAQTDWTRDFGGDGFQPYYLDASDSKALFETQRGGIYWYSDVDGMVDLSLGDVFAGIPVNWNAPYKPLVNGELIAGTNQLVVMDSPPFGQWQSVSTDLTRTAMGATTPGSYHTITEIASNPFVETQIITGTSDGLVWKGDYLQGGWTNITASLPEHYVSAVSFSKKTNGKMYVAMTGYYNNFDQALVYKSENGGQSWTDISSNLPAIGVNALITYMVAGNEVLFLGTDGGVFYSEDDGQNWLPVGSNFPVSVVSALDIDEVNNKLIAGTFGRSMWSYDLNWYIGLAEASLEQAAVYPNPVIDQLNISSNVQYAQIIAAGGKVVWEQQEQSDSIQADVSFLPAGLYLVKTDKKWYRFVKQ